MNILNFLCKKRQEQKKNGDAINAKEPYIDEMGIIPDDVNVLVPSYYMDEPLVQWSIAERQGAFYLQKWTRAGMMKEWQVPIIMATATSVKGFENFHENGDVIAITETNHDSLERHMLFYQDSQGRTLFFNVNSEVISKEELLVATVDAKAVRYSWGEDYLLMHDFGPELCLNVFDAEAFNLEDVEIPMNEIPFKEIELPISWY